MNAPAAPAQLDRARLLKLTGELRLRAVEWADREAQLISLAKTDLVAMSNAVYHAAESGEPLEHVRELIELLQTRAFAASFSLDLAGELYAAFPEAFKREGTGPHG